MAWTLEFAMRLRASSSQTPGPSPQRALLPLSEGTIRPQLARPARSAERSGAFVVGAPLRRSGWFDPGPDVHSVGSKVDEKELGIHEVRLQGCRPGERMLPSSILRMQDSAGAAVSNSTRRGTRCR